MSSSLEEQIALLAKAYKPVRQAFLPESIATHHRVVRTDPAILVCALVSWCADKCTLPRQYWDRVDEISARVRGRYPDAEERRKNHDNDTDL